MYVVFRVVNSDYANREVVAICSDLCFAEYIVSCLVTDVSFCDNTMYIIDSGEDM